MNVGKSEIIGDRGAGTFMQLGSTHAIGAPTLGTADLILGKNNTSSGYYKMVDSGSFASTNALSVNGNTAIGVSGAGTFDQENGIFNAGTTSTSTSYSFTIGEFHAASYTLHRFGQLNVNGTEYIGEFSTGTFTQTDPDTIHNLGSAARPSALQVGVDQFFPGIGTYSLGGGALNVFGTEDIGAGGAGTFLHNGGSHTLGSNAAPGTLTLGASSSAVGTYSLNGATLAVYGEEHIGQSGAGTFVQQAGTHSIGSPTLTTGGLFLANAAGGSGYYSLTLGSLQVYGTEGIGERGSATFTQSLAVHTLGSSSHPGQMRFGLSSTGKGIYTVTNGGSLTVFGQVDLGINGAGTINQSSGTVTFNSDPAFGDVALQLAIQSNSGGAYFLSGSNSSLLVTGQEIISNSGSALFVQSGGTHALLGANGTMTIGSDSDLTGGGRYVLNSGTLSTSMADRIGYVGSGTFTQFFGTHTIGTATSTLGGLQIGNLGNGEYYLGGGVLTVYAGEQIGIGGNGTFTQMSGIHNLGTTSAPATISFGTDIGAGTYSLGANGSGGTLNVLGTESIGALGAGSFIQGGGANNVGSAATIGSLNVGQFGQGHYVMNGGTLTCFGDETVGINGAGTFDQSGGTNNVGTVAKPSNLLLAIASGTGTYLLSGSGVLNASSSVYVAGTSTAAHNPGTFIISGGQAAITSTLKVWDLGHTEWNAGSLTLSSLVLQGHGSLAMGVGRNKLLKVTSLSIDTSDTNQLNINDNAVAIDYSGAVGTLVEDTRQNIRFLHIYSGSATGNQVIGYGDNNILHKTTFFGQPVDFSTILVELTINGDANLDGKVNALDFNAVAANFGATNSFVFTQGDFNGDGKVDAGDFTAVSMNFNQSLAPPPSPALGTLVPEPMMVGAVILSGMSPLVLKRRRRRIAALHP